MVQLFQGVAILLDTISDNLRHPDYERVVNIANDYKIYITLEGIKEKLKRFNQREPVDLFDQRVILTKDALTTGDIAGGCMKPMYKIGRAPATKQLVWKTPEDTTKNTKEIETLADMFYGEKSVNEYLTDSMVDFDGTDPNAFLIVEFTSTDGTGKIDPNNTDNKLVVYPFEVSSEEAINFVYKNNILQWIIVLKPVVIATKKDERVGEKYTIYLSENSLVATEIDKSLIADFRAENEIIEIDVIDEDTKFIPGELYFFTTRSKTKKRHYIINVFEHKIGFVPARRFGTRLDLVTNKRTCVPMIHQARPYFEQAIKTVSEFILTNCLHVFPQKIQYSDPCLGYTYTDKEVTNIIGCNSGMTPDGKTCKACNGSGFKYHQSSQDMLQIRMPKNLDEMVSLENVLVYKFPPIELLEFLKTLGLYEMRYFAQKAVYNSEVFSKEDVQTATEKIIDLDSVYDTLKPFADSYSAMWRHIYKCIIALRGLEKDSEVVHMFPNDFKMKPASLLLEDLNKATTNGAPSHIKKAIIRDITDKLYIDRPEEVLKINTKEKYFPFTGKTDTEINYILANDLCSKRNRILYSNFEMIFADLEFDAAQSKEPLSFYQMTEIMQRELLDAKIGEFIAEIEIEDADAAATVFNGAAGKALLDEVPVGPDGKTLDLTKFNPDGTPIATPEV